MAQMDKLAMPSFYELGIQDDDDAILSLTPFCLSLSTSSLVVESNTEMGTRHPPELKTSVSVFRQVIRAALIHVSVEVLKNIRVYPSADESEVLRGSTRRRVGPWVG